MATEHTVVRQSASARKVGLGLLLFLLGVGLATTIAAVGIGNARGATADMLLFLGGMMAAVVGPQVFLQAVHYDREGE